MEKKYAALEGIDNVQGITGQSREEFLYRLQTGLLLALKESGQLNEIQYGYAQEKLDRQHGGPAKRIPEVP